MRQQGIGGPVSVLVIRFRQKGKGLCLSLSQVNKEVIKSLMEVIRKSESYLCHVGKGGFFVVNHFPEHKSGGILEL